MAQLSFVFVSVILHAGASIVQHRKNCAALNFLCIIIIGGYIMLAQTSHSQ